MRLAALTGAAAAAGARQRWLLRQSLLLLLSAAALFWLFEHSDLDRIVEAWFFDPALQNFPLRRHWLFESVLHQGAKQVAYVGAAACMWLCWQGWRRQLDWLPPRNALLAALGMVLIPLGVATLKQLINRHCPWDMIDFGGFAPYQGLFTAHPADIKAGVCFPAGHATTGFLWLVWAIALRPAGRQWARRALLLALAAGVVLGGARMAQGAHFLSHTLWSLWFAWALSVSLAALVKAEVRDGVCAPDERPLANVAAHGGGLHSSHSPGGELRPYRHPGRSDAALSTRSAGSEAPLS